VGCGRSPRYDIWDLFEDDPVVLAKFEFYTTTGRMPFPAKIPQDRKHSNESGKKVPKKTTPPPSEKKSPKTSRISMTAWETK